MKNKLPSHFADQLNLPVIAAPMFLVSSPELVIAGCKEGIIGSFPTLNARTPEILDNWMGRITDELKSLRVSEPKRRIAPWAVNLIVHRTNDRLRPDLDLVIKYRPPIVITSIGNPAAVVETVHGYGGLVFSDVLSLHHARKAAEAGVDGLFLVCTGAGGHGGTINSFAFVEAVQEFWNGIIVLAGGISSGQAILAAQAMGVDLVYMGTRFIVTTESIASEKYKEMLIQSTLENIVYTDFFTGVNGNYLKSSIELAGLNPDNLKKYEKGYHTSHGKAKAWKDIWSAGHGVGRVKRVEAVSQLVGDLRREYDQALHYVRKNPYAKSETSM